VLATSAQPSGYSPLTGHIGPDVVERQCDQCKAREKQRNSDKITFTLFIAAWYCGE
jgi:hypothetical protein